MSASMAEEILKAMRDHRVLWEIGLDEDCDILAKCDSCGYLGSELETYEHQANIASEMLAAAGYGKLEDAFEQGRKSGIRHADRVHAALKLGKPELAGPPSPNPYRSPDEGGADAVTGFPRSAYKKRRPE